MNIKLSLLNFLNSILFFRVKFAGINPFFRIFHHQFLATYNHNIWVKEQAKKPEGLILDFGCGSMPYKDMFLKHTSYIGIDLDTNVLANIFVVDGYKIPLNDKSVNGLISTQVLEHVENIDEVLSEWKRVLAPGSSIIITVPFLYSAHGLPFDYRRFTKEGLVKLFSDNNFELKEVVTFGGLGTYLVLGIQNWLESQPGRLFLLFKLILSPLYPFYSLVLNLFGIGINKIDKTNIFYSSTGVVLRKKE